MFPKSIQDHSGKVLGPPGHQKTSKGWQNIHLEASGKFPKIDPKSDQFEGVWGSKILDFLMLAHVLPAAGPRGETLIDS